MSSHSQGTIFSLLCFIVMKIMGSHFIVDIVESYLCMEGFFFPIPINANQLLSSAVSSIPSRIKIYIKVVTS